MTIREATEKDFQGIWPIFSEIVSAGKTYGYDPDATREEGFRIWMSIPLKTFVYEDSGEILGTYYIKNNYDGPGSHVCNCGYMVSSDVRGQGIGTTMCEHSQQTARKLGYKSMQFNFVASSNEGAIRLWRKLGFSIVGRLPDAFNQPELGYIDAYIMYKWLT